MDQATIVEYFQSQTRTMRVSKKEHPFSLPGHLGFETAKEGDPEPRETFVHQDGAKAFRFTVLQTNFGVAGIKHYVFIKRTA